MELQSPFQLQARCPGSEEMRERQTDRRTDRQTQQEGGRDQVRQAKAETKRERCKETGRYKEKVIRMQQKDKERKIMRRAGGNSSLEIGEKWSEGRRQK